MALSTGAKIALGIATLGIGVVVYDKLAENKTKKAAAKNAPKEPELPGETYEPPEPESREEPDGGWQLRWEEQGDAAVASCRVDPNVRTFSQAQVCMLSLAFPEAAPWGGGTDTWEPWMTQARDQVRTDIQVLVTDEIGGFGANGWQFTVWLLFKREISSCYREVGDDLETLMLCVSSRLFPDYTWPPPALDVSGWQMQAWSYLRDRVEVWLDDKSQPPGGRLGI